ncbi:MAG: class I SAM-dependent methyltransferase [Clostridia bacterium]|nr:class I SAM-dependent methyltransferase [Clostridia bacterium]
MGVTWLETKDLFPAVIKKLKRTRIILDIGCGIRPQNYIKPQVHICCEPFGQYIEHLQNEIKAKYDRHYVLINATWAEAIKLFPVKSVDTVFLVDVIEHLEKEEALNLLKATEEISKQQIAVFTPLGFLPQLHPDGKDAWGLDGGAWQEHKSGWQPEDFDETWDIYATKVFHTTDNTGRQFETPFGALWAIKSFKDHNYHKKNDTIERESLHAAIDKVLDVAHKLRLLRK